MKGRRWWNPLGWDAALVAPGPPGPLVLMRVLIVSVIGARLLLRRWWVMAERPDALFDPVPFLAWLPGQPGAAAIVAVWALGLASVAATLWASATGRHVTLPFVGAWLSLLVLAGLWGSAGKVMHNDVLLLSVAVPLLFASSPTRPTGSTDAIDADAPAARWGWPPRAALIVLAVVYFLTGVQKLRHSGPGWAFGDNMSWVIRQGRSPFGDDFSRAIADQEWLTRSMSAGALALELVAPALLAVRRTRPWFALSATAMHLSIWAFLGLDYYGWVLAVWAVVIPMSTLGERWWRTADLAPSPAQVRVNHG